MRQLPQLANPGDVWQNSGFYSNRCTATLCLPLSHSIWKLIKRCIDLLYLYVQQIAFYVSYIFPCMSLNSSVFLSNVLPAEIQVLVVSAQPIAWQADVRADGIHLVSTSQRDRELLAMLLF